MKNDGIILRNELMRLFDGFSEERIIYVCAPAGYGKTVAVRQWLDGDIRTKAVISLDEYDNNPIHFCERFCTALQACQPQNTVLAEIVSHPAFGSAPDEFSAQAIAALLEKEHSVLVIDDLHVITDERVLRLILTFLSRLPKTFQIVLISRYDLPCVFSDLLIDGHFAKVTAEQLLLSKEEVVLLYRKHGNSVTSEQVENIYRFTGGWAIGVRALLLSGGEPSGENLDLLDQFILQNVWERWDAPTRKFMLKTAIADELTSPLCAALTDNPDSEKILNQLVHQNAFISRTGSGGYRYHQLFKNFLCKLLEKHGEKLTCSLLNKAGYWYLSERDFYSAAECFIKCEDHEGIAKCFMLLVDIGHQNFIIEKLIPIINSSMINAVAKKCPYIYSLLSWAAFNQGRADDQAYYSDQYYKHHPEISRSDPRLTLNIVYVSMTDFRNTMHGMIASLRELPKLIATQTVALDIKAGTINQNMPLMHRGTRDLSEFAGEIDDLLRMKNADALKFVFGGASSLLIECAAAGLLYEQGNLERAYSLAITANAEIKESFSPESKFHAISILVHILDALGRTTDADMALTRISDMIETDRAYYLCHNFAAMAMRRKLEKHDTLAAGEWLSVHNETMHADLSFYQIYATFTTCRAYITAGDYDSAIILLTKALKLATAYNRPLDIIEAKTFLSIAYWNKKLNSKEEAIRHFEDAVSLAYGFGYTQIFVNNGARLSEMTLRLQTSEQHGDEDTAYMDFIKMLASKILEQQIRSLVSGRPAKSTHYTDKQIIVMKLLCEGKNYKEITEIMGIKLPTLRSHIALIYRKLDATSETDAIMKIKASGILNE